ncbi:ROK family transcriptional regulator [Rhodobium gokarnense]|uniref:NBD/HSP70 family sugar kinase/putative transcriptional regulator n=1 Tax=Rhodobium gokarnense TaxID=364296 RepID=A0ABT3HH00_9HYPH|nr:ROK family transcriptional regulator [Rhodobium gokarnense]MCW2309629.1 putative NBD/HSP70 family sugar kinase/putative transcriptional regulator [Rhodobium gokarnense]
MIDFSSVPMSRQITLRTVMRTVMDRGPISRAELARITGLSKQTMSEVFRFLEDDGWLEVTGRTQGTVGRSAATYEITPNRALVFGADVGGTKIQAALADMNGKIVAETAEPTDPRGGEHVISQLVSLNGSLAEKAGLPPERVMVGTVGIPGAYNRKTGRLIMVPNIPDLEGVPLQAILTERMGCMVHIGNDVNMAAKGEQWLGEGKGFSNFVFIALGTGIGMGIINERQILNGARGAAGEIATLPIGADPFDSRTFHSGALETMVGSAAIRDRYESYGGTPGLSVRDIMDSIEAGDERARATISEVARNIAAAILAVSAIVDPERVILGGSIGARPELLECVRAALPLCMPSPPECTISQLGSRAGLYGTLANSIDHMRENLFELPRYAPVETAAVAETAK